LTSSWLAAVRPNFIESPHLAERVGLALTGLSPYYLPLLFCAVAA
jgi:hypothetical protein